MALSDDIERLLPKKDQSLVKQNNQSDQLQLADHLERVLKSVGVQVQPRFEIPISRRARSTSI